jgi:hypothetical protein
VIERKSHAVDQNLAAIERAEISGLRVAEPDDAEELAVDGIGDRDGVGKLFGGIDAIAMADRDVRIAGGAGHLSCPALSGGGAENNRQRRRPHHDARHVTAPQDAAEAALQVGN